MDKNDLAPLGSRDRDGSFDPQRISKPQAIYLAIGINMQGAKLVLGKMKF